MAVDYDSHRLVKNFKAAGFTEAQAEAFVDALRAWQAEMTKTFATKADLDLAIERLRGELRTEIRDSRIAVIQWVAAMLFVQAGFIVSLIKLLP